MNNPEAQRRGQLLTRNYISKTQEALMQFNALSDALAFALRKEHDANELYKRLEEMVKNPGTKTLLVELAKQELGHVKLIEKAMREERVDFIGGAKKIQDLHLSDYLVEQEITEESSPQDVMIYAIKMERSSYGLYSALLENYKGTEIEEVLSHLQKEELMHKERLEREYDEHFMKEM